jgi:hypothetical protein
MTKDVAARFGQAVYAITDGKDRHKSTCTHTLALLSMGAKGQAGVGYAIRELNKVFVQAVGPEREHGENEADHEFQRMILGAGRLLDEGEGEEGAGDDTDTGETPDPGATPANVQQSWSGPLPTVALLHDILEEAGKDVRELGVVGEESTVKAVFLSLVSRLQDQPVSVGVKGDSSSGKSWVVKKVVRLFPDWAFHARTAMSGKALIYSAEEYVQRTIILYEVTGMRENSDDDMTAYFIRTLLSEGRIDYEVTVKDPHTGGMTTNRITKEGPTNLIFTTTQDNIHAENETRVLSLNTDDSNEQTKRVMEQLADETASTVDLGRWHDLQQWLASDEAEKRVTIPFAKALSRLTPPSAVRLRRDFGAILALIRAHAMLHQATRQRDADEQIIATVEQDYDAVRKLVSPAISQGIGATVSDTLITTVAAVQALNEEYTRIGKSLGATNGAVAKRLNVNTSTASRRLKAAARREYVQNLETKSGVAARWVVGDEPLPETAEILPTVAALQDRCTGVAAGNGSDQDNCSVAADSGVEGVEEECTS